MREAAGTLEPAAVPAHLWPEVVAVDVSAEVLAVTPAACFLRLHRTVLALLARDAVALPFGVRTAVPSARSPWRGLTAGALVPVHSGRLALPAATLAMSRWWRPPSVRASRPSVALRGGLRALRAGLPPGPEGIVVSPRASPRRLLGLGPGLTPYGDDVLAGRLLAAAAWGTEPGLPAAVLGAAEASTTAVSVACLVEAAHGRGVPAAVRLVDAVGAGDADAVAAALPALLAVGHTSGHGVAVGVLHGVTAAAERQAA